MSDMSAASGVAHAGAAVVRRIQDDPTQEGVRSSSIEVPASLTPSMFAVHALYGDSQTSWQASPAGTFVLGLCHFRLRLRPAGRELLARVRTSVPLVANAIRTIRVVSPGNPVLLNRIVSFGPSCCLVNLTLVEVAKLVDIVGVLDSLKLVPSLRELLNTAFDSQLDPSISDQYVEAVAALACYAVAYHYAIRRDEVWHQSETPFDHFFALLFEGNLPLGMLDGDQVVVLVGAVSTEAETVLVA